MNYIISLSHTVYNIIVYLFYITIIILHKYYFIYYEYYYIIYMCVTLFTFVLYLLFDLSSEQPLTEFVEKEVPPPVEQQSTSSLGANIFRRAFLEARTNRNNSTKNYRKLGSPDATKIALICSLYQTALHTLTQMKIEILTGKYIINHCVQSYMRMTL